MTMTTEREVRACLPARDADTHKGTYGRALFVCGHYGMAGAPLLAAKGALRCGVGLAELCLPDRVYALLAAAVPEAVFTPLPTADGGWDRAALPILTQRIPAAQSIVCGCGLGRGDTVPAVVQTVLTASVPVVLDADGINAANRHILFSDERTAPLILTPHPAEMARLCGISVEQVQQDRVGIAVDTARRCRCVVVLKGHHTVIASPCGEVRINPTGNAGMATGGSGDVLAGMLGALTAQGISPWDAAVCGVYVHGLAGDRAAKRISQTALLPSDIIEELGRIFVDWGL